MGIGQTNPELMPSTITNAAGQEVFTTLTHGGAALYLLEKAGKTLDDVYAFCGDNGIEVMVAGNGDKWFHPYALNKVMYG